MEAAFLEMSPFTTMEKPPEMPLLRLLQKCIDDAFEVCSSPRIDHYKEGKNITGSFANAIHGLNASHMTKVVMQRSKRMILDTLGVGLLGTKTDVFQKMTQYSKIYSSDASSSVWAHPDVRLPPLYAAFVNGVAVHSMDFDDTWHPTTHPSGAVLPALLAISEALPEKQKVSGLDLLLAFNVGIEVQGRLMHFSNEASYLPRRFHPPSILGTLGSAAAAAKLLGLNQYQCKEALAIAASYAGAPLANAATQTKPLHMGNASRHGLEAAFLASLGLQANKLILDLESGFGAFYTDYSPQSLPSLQSYSWLLDQQDVAIKRFPAHLGTHWMAEAALAVRKHLAKSGESLPSGRIKTIVLSVPDIRYVNRQFPTSEHEARHSFQFAACTALLDGYISMESFKEKNISRPELNELLRKTHMEHSPDNKPSFNTLYCDMNITLHDGEVLSERCDTFYGHWRKPLSQGDLVKKFQSNASTALSTEATESIVEIVDNLEKLEDSSILTSLLQGARSAKDQLQGRQGLF
ncbi:cis-aconitate decarboxylase [Hemicordylus capensis]|uniref:cis-aconitate decarboxylase n=1 Tax=Hemicordylus capensis TaxID=884348 RepID=UPI002302DE28|nr:cis-aconitate decarboxylase [Hemicordylus capensis]